MLIAIYSGSFNPIHLGHTELCRYMARHRPCGIDAIRLLVTPRNPLKPHAEMASDDQRLAMARLASEDIEITEADDFEMTLDPPYYSLRTLESLARKYPQHSFRLVIGADNWLQFDKWRDPGTIISKFGLIVYPRPGYAIDNSAPMPTNVTYLADAPLSDISSTMIRRRIALGQDISNLVPHKVAEYIHTHNLYTPSNTNPHT